MSATGREAADDYSKAGAISPAARGSLGALGSIAAGLGLAGAILAIVANWSKVIVIKTPEGTLLRSLSGHHRHSVALVLLGAAALVMLVGAVRGARPAMGAIAVLGLAVLLIAILADLPHRHDAGDIGTLYDARASLGAGYYLETASGILMMVGGVALLMLAPRGRRVRVSAREAEPPAPAPAASAPPAPPPTPSPRPEPTSAAPPPSPPLAPRVLPPSEDPDYQPRQRPERRRSGGLVGRLRRRG